MGMSLQKRCPMCHRRCWYKSYACEIGVEEFYYDCKCGGFHWAFGETLTKKPKWYRFVRLARYKRFKRNV